MGRVMVMAAVLAGGVNVLAQGGDAARVMAGVREALGGAAALAAVETLTAKGTITRVTPRGTTEGAAEVAIALPDRFMTRTAVAGEGSMTVYRHAGFNGDGPINELDAPPNLNAPMRARMGGVDRPGGAAGREPTAEEKAAARQRQVVNARKEFARLALGFFGSSSAVFPLEFTYAAEAESGEGTAHVLDVKGPEGFQGRLFVDTKTSLPLMLAWSEPRGPAPNAPIVERRIYYSDYRRVDGISLPHTIQRAVDGKVTEETHFTEITVNPKIDDKKFAVSK